MRRDRVLITVKTYPTLSRKYGETVCTAGVRADGSWVRIYPVPFHRLDEAEQYKKFDWVECDLIRNTSDPRPETYRPKDMRAMQPVAHLGTSDEWRERRELLTGKARVFTRLAEVIDGAKSNRMSLAVFKPTKILGFKCEEEEREWDVDKVEQMRAKTSQMEIFAEDTWRQTFKLIRKLPYSFSYRFADADGTSSELQVLDWEIGALYWNCLASVDGDEKAAIGRVRAKYLDEFCTKDLHFFLGTTQAFHLVAPNPWVIIGVLPLPVLRQLPLL
ncbi:MAG: hypothetical protein ACREN6_13750 [Gemmatimonadaceae bacterium]